jgi:hypothetical protein
MPLARLDSTGRPFVLGTAGLTTLGYEHETRVINRIEWGLAPGKLRIWQARSSRFLFRRRDINTMQAQSSCPEQCSMKIPPGDALRYVLTC